MNHKQFLSSILLALAPFSLELFLPNAPALAQTDNYPILACQYEINRRLMGRGAGDSFVRFNDDVRQSFVSNARARVQGRGQKVDRYSDGTLVPSSFVYECSVNTRNGRVTDSRYALESTENQSPSQTPNRTRIVSLCQEAVQKKVQENRLGGILGAIIQGTLTVAFPGDTEIYRVSRVEQGVRGSATLTEQGQTRQISYNCTVNTQEGVVTQVNYY